MSPRNKLFLVILALCSGLGLSGGLLRVYGQLAAQTPIDWPVEGEKPGQATFMGRYPSGGFGSGMATGDVNGDGIDDLITTARYETDTTRSNGVVYVIPGPLSLEGTYSMPYQAALMIEGTNDSQLGAYLDSGDMNGDGFDDIAMTTWINEKTYIYLGSAEIQANSPMSIPISAAPLALTVSPTRAGTVFCDFNGDHYQDLFVIQYSLDARVQIWGILGRSSLTSTLPLDLQMPADADIIIAEDTMAGWLIPNSMNFVCGDFNGDGAQDLALGIPGESPQDHYEAGSVYVIPGDQSITTGEPVTLTLPDQTGMILDGLDGYALGGGGDQLGTSLAAADINLDGKDDLVIGARAVGA